MVTLIARVGGMLSDALGSLSKSDVAEAKRLLEEDASEDLAQELTWSACDHGCPEIVEMAIGRLPWPRRDSRWHWIIIQPIRGAKSEGHFQCMAVLLRHGVDANVARYGQRALHFAAAYSGAVSDADRARFAAMLLDAGAKLDVRDDLLKSTPLGWACRWGRTKVAELLIARGAVIDEPDAEDWGSFPALMSRLEVDSCADLSGARAAKVGAACTGNHTDA